MLFRLLGSLRDHAPEVDVLVVDSASVSAETQQVAAAAGVRCLRLERPGLSVARNAGLRAVTSEVVAFTDDDCVVRDVWVAPLLERFTDPRVGVVTGEMMDEDGTPPTGRNRLPREARRTVDGLDLGHGANMAFRRAAVLDVGGFDERLGAGTAFAGAEDLDMFCRLLHAGWRGIREPRSAVVHAHTRLGTNYTRLIQGYAMGSGAALAKMLRLDRAVGADMTLVILRRLVRNAVTDSLHRDTRSTLVAHATGLAAGWRKGMALSLVDQNFAPEPDQERVAA